MIGYVTVGTNDLKKAGAFYDKICGELGMGRFMENDRIGSCQLAVDPGVPVH